MIPKSFSLGPLEQDLEAAGAQAFSALAALWNEEHTRRLVRLPPDTTAADYASAEASVMPGKASATRLNACISDVVAFAPAVRHLQHVGHAAQAEMTAAWARLTAHGTTEEGIAAAHAAWRPGQAFTASLKAIHFFIRALQDAAYAVLHEMLTEQHASRRSSMNAAAEDACDPVRTVLDLKAGGYLAWFTSHRALRNRFKEGLLTGVAYGSARDVPAILMTAGRGGLSLEVVDDALRQSIRVVDVVISESRRARTERAERVLLVMRLEDGLRRGELLPTPGDLETFCGAIRPRVEPSPSRQETISRIGSRLRRLPIDDVREAVARAGMLG